MFIAVQFSPTNAKTYTYSYDEPHSVEVGDIVQVEHKATTKSVIVAAVNVPQPVFACKSAHWPVDAVPVEPAPPPVGHNSPPSAIDDVLAPFGDVISEAESWLDGGKVETEGQMKAADALLKGIKEAAKAVDAARDAATKPLNDAWKGEIARWKPTQDDLARIVKGLVAIVDGFKRQLAAEKDAARKEAERLAWEATRAAQEATRQADAADIDATRAAAQAMQDAEDAQRAAARAAKDVVLGMRATTCYEVTDHRALLNWIAKNARDDVTAFVDEWARKNHRDHRAADGLRVWVEDRAY